MKKKYIVFAALSAVLTLLFSCNDDFLERPPLDTLTSDQFYKSDDEVLAATGPLYNVVWRAYNDNASFLLGDMRGGVLMNPWSADVREQLFFRTTGVTQSNIDAYKAFFVVIGQSNMAILNINKYAGSKVSANVKNQAIAEARFMRATAYSYLVMNFGPVPIITNNIENINKADLQRNTEASIWEFITRDYLFAAANLPEKANQQGRLTKWSAEGMLARTYLTRAGVGQNGGRDLQLLAKAKEYAERVITMSGKSLLANYENLFIWNYDNNNESLFELQWVFSADDYDAANSMVSKIAPYPEISVNNDAWGGSHGASLWMLSLYDGLIANEGRTVGYTLDKRLKASFMMPGFYYPEITVKRQLGPYNNPGNKFTAPSPDGEHGLSADRVRIKKYVVGNELDLGGQALSQRYPNNVYMLRLAEMYLIYVEACIGSSGSTADSKALDYFNKVRNRAGLLNHQGQITIMDVFKESAKEFAMEARTWYDLVRMHYYNPEQAYSIINSQYRGQYLCLPDRMPNPTGWTFSKLPSESEPYAIVNSGNFGMQIPAVELSQAPNLNKEPVPYEFKD